MNNTEKRLWMLSIYQISGGLIGIGFILTSLLNIGSINGPLLLILIILMIAFGLFLFSIYSGYILFKKEFIRGINLSILNNAIQVIGFGVLGYGFKYVSGIIIGMRLDLTNDIIFLFDFNLTSWKMNYNANPELTYLSINIFAILIIRFLYIAKKEIEDHKDCRTKELKFD